MSIETPQMSVARISLSAVMSMGEKIRAQSVYFCSHIFQIYIIKMATIIAKKSWLSGHISKLRVKILQIMISIFSHITHERYKLLWLIFGNI